MLVARSRPAAFAALRRRLLARRFEAVELRLRLEMLALGGLVGGFLFWQARVPLDGLQRRQGPLAVAAVVAALLALLAVIGGVVAGIRHHRHLREAPPGPAWLALPIPPRLLREHLGWEAGLGAAWAAAAAPGIVAAAWGLVPLPALAGLTLLFVALLFTATLAGVAAGRLVATPRAGGFPDPIVRALATAVRPTRTLPAAQWRRRGPAAVLMAKDLLLTRRHAVLRSRLGSSVLILLAAAAAWHLPLPPDVARFIAFGLALLAASRAAEWLLALSGTDPFGILRVLPLGAGLLWTTRAGWAAAFALLVVTSQALAAHGVPAEARALFLMWSGIATFAIALLGVHYGITLFPRAALGARLLTLSLALSMVASLMIPLLGWLVLLTAVIHSARRVPRWARLDPAA